MPFGMIMSCWGLSPRRRGNPSGSTPAGSERGSIPAQAGEPGRYSASAIALRVYPRAGGGTAAPDLLESVKAGLSPRRRGNPLGQAGPGHGRGSIPAQAGEPPRSSRRGRPGRVYPRAGGGTAIDTPSAVTESGLSPRRRGNRGHRAERPVPRGSIPAQAGEPWRARTGRGSTWVYPRAGGGTSQPRSRGCATAGLSPRRRGNQVAVRVRARERGSIPAQAGEPRPPRPRRPTAGVYPRAGGGTYSAAGHCFSDGGLSPRRRGNRLRAPRPRPVVGSIPAQAGEPDAVSDPGVPRRVYPRAGGGTAVSSNHSVTTHGLSPRRRGNRQHRPASSGAQGSIPAQAGEPISRPTTA